MTMQQGTIYLISDTGTAFTNSENDARQMETEGYRRCSEDEWGLAVADIYTNYGQCRDANGLAEVDAVSQINAPVDSIIIDWRDNTRWENP